ncbi:hypothetical protein C1878_10650 [Gordonibacter sp. 28C]|uniref:tetratricopeptide repeat protein n=1 Tax=Gordonibacter sp. 28C TaxID=2078569 RepID=UPI000DF80027|nr:tetratricopeptide repeat protein [Gordonibacter sp. 28C]RDB61486.1 hypothetical protein C1878_10650 [Gordonibacter sp. 28C]
MRQAEKQGGTYTIAAGSSLWGASRRVLPDAVVPIAPVPAGSPAPTYGWVTGACASPSKGDRYIVEFSGKRDFRILAYVDRFGRVFSVDHPIVSPPARKPDLDFARFAEQEATGEERGCVEVRSGEGEGRQVAQYTRRRDRYTFSDTWFDFGPYGADLSYDDALARAYLAFVHRPALGGAEVPTRGIGFVHEHLRGAKLLPGLRAIVDDVRRAEADPVVRPPALAWNLVRWLEDAGLDDLTAPAVSDDALRLVKTVRYANLYYVALEDEEAPVSRHTVWALEAALNRFSLVEEAFGDRAPFATDADCARWDAYLIETAGARPLAAERVAGAPVGADGGEWEVRCRISSVLERLRLPVRVESRLQANVAEGLAAFMLTVPDAALMPLRHWVDAPSGSGWVDATEAERDAQARRYAMHFGLALAAAAFEASPSVQRVDVAARPLDDSTVGEEADGAGQGGEFPSDHEGTAFYQVAFSRQAYEGQGRFLSALEGDPSALFALCGAVWDLPAADPFALVAALPSTVRRRELPEMADEALPEAVRPVLGADDARELRIVTEARRRRIGEGLADRVACSSSATEAIRAVREEQDAAEARGDGLTVSACTRLMAALAEGELDTEDQNAVVVRFLGEDRCLAALGRARALAQRDPEEAVAVLMDAVAETAALDGYVDGVATVYRSFDSYAARVLYGRALRDARLGRADAVPTDADAPVLPAVPTLAARAAADAEKRVELAPDSFYLCHLEIVTLLERSFERVDDALRYGQRAIELAPSTAGGYRQLGRAYMLVGDMDNAAAVLDACLRVAVQPADVAVAYYQLAYALWKAGRPRAGAACYLKSVMTSPVVALQAMAELKELADEHGIGPIEREAVDDELRGAGIVVAPVDEVFEALDAGAAAAVDAGLFPVARNLLSLRLHYRPDDALVNVLKSLED